MRDYWHPGLIARRIEDPLKHTERAENHCSPAVAWAIMPAIGTEWLVYAVQYHWSPEEELELEYLRLKGQPSDLAFDARMFQKVSQTKAQVERRADEPLPDREVECA